ncbi:MAG: hypothetical protein ABJO12_06775 [Flavobacteriaceae bacterium]
MLILFIFFLGFSQEDKGYFVITIESQTVPKYHGLEKYYWIIPFDSLSDSSNYKASPFYFEGISNDNLENCSKGLSVDLFTSTTDTNFNFPETYKNEMVKFESTILSGRKKVQSINKKWSNKGKKKTEVFVTPIKGDLCFCRASGVMTSNFGISELIAIPKGKIIVDQSLLNSDKGKEVLQIDFSKYTYSNKI